MFTDRCKCEMLSESGFIGCVCIVSVIWFVVFLLKVMKLSLIIS